MCGIQRETWNRYEKGLNAPGTEVLAAIAQAGADVNYILTGQRSGAMPLFNFTDEEKALIDRYRAMGDAGQDALVALLASLNGKAKAKSGKVVIHGKVGQQTKVDGDMTISSMNIDMSKKKP